MTMIKYDNSSIWNRIRLDQDVDDLIYRDEESGERESVTYSER